MAVYMNVANVDVVYSSSAVVTAAPITMACWYKKDSHPDGNFHVVMGINSTGAPENGWILFVDNSDVLNFQTLDDGSGSTAQQSGSGGSGWHHACGVSSGASSRFAYRDGSAGTENTGTQTPTTAGLNRTSLGNYYYALGGNWSGINQTQSVAEGAVWNVALTADEITSLARGYSPMLIRPSALVWYVPAVRTLIDLKGNAISGANSGIVDHPPILNYKPVANILGIAPVASKAMPIFSRPPRFLRRAA